MSSPSLLPPVQKRKNEGWQEIPSGRQWRPGEGIYIDGEADAGVEKYSKMPVNLFFGIFEYF